MTPSTLWTETPLIYSSHISDRLGCSAYLKLENLQSSQSFKYRGISLRLQESIAQHGSALHAFVASSGNGGLAVAVAARRLGVKCTVYLPVAVAKGTQDILRMQGAEVVLIGQIYSEALQAMYQAMEKEPHAVAVSAYDDPVIWRGHSSMVKEMKSQLYHPPDAIICSVGGGGLIGGILLGCQSIAWDNIPIFGLETHGSNCFYHALSVNTQGFNSKVPSLPTNIPPEAPYTIKINEEHRVAVPYMHALTSRAASLGATSPAPGVVHMALSYAGGVKCISVPDELAMFAAREFADEHKFLIELACATAMSPAYNRELFWHVLDPASKLSAEERQKKTVVFVVCGGVKITPDELWEYAQILDGTANVEQEWKVLVNGAEIRVRK